MKTGYKTALLYASAVVLLDAQFAFAEGAPPVPVASPQPQVTVQAPAQAPVPAPSASLPIPSASGSAMAQDDQDTLADDEGDDDTPSADSPSGKKGSSLKDSEKKIPETVKNAIKNLDRSKDALTLSDLNSARQAIAKVDMLIELEKKLRELEKIREDSKPSSKAAMAAAIPSSALIPPPSLTLPKFNPEPVAVTAPPPTITADEIEISRIVGGSGRYKAVIKKSDGTLRTVQVGDKLPGNSVVTSISPTELVLLQNGNKDTVRVKNVDVVFGSAP